MRVHLVYVSIKIHFTVQHNTKILYTVNMNNENVTNIIINIGTVSFANQKKLNCFQSRLSSYVDKIIEDH
jgi:hypothetical protein